ncbi:ATP-dependent Clp protease adapter protein ClpS [Bienertia sinuspersici]
MNKLEELIKSMFPNYGLKATPHIEFGLDAEKKMLQVEKAVFDEWVKLRLLNSNSYLIFIFLLDIIRTGCFKYNLDTCLLLWQMHKKQKGLFGVPFTHFETLTEIYMKDKAITDASESFTSAIEDMDQ